MMIDKGPKLHTVLSRLLHDLIVNVTEFRILLSYRFVLKVIMISFLQTLSQILFKVLIDICPKVKAVTPPHPH